MNRVPNFNFTRCCIYYFKILRNCFNGVYIHKYYIMYVTLIIFFLFLYIKQSWYNMYVYNLFIEIVCSVEICISCFHVLCTKKKNIDQNIYGYLYYKLEPRRMCCVFHDTSWCINKHCLYKYVMVYGIINLRKKVKSTWSMANWKIAASVLLKLFIVSNERCHTNHSFSRMRWRLAWRTLWVSE